MYGNLAYAQTRLGSLTVVNSQSEFGMSSGVSVRQEGVSLERGKGGLLKGLN